LADEFLGHRVYATNEKHNVNHCDLQVYWW